MSEAVCISGSLLYVWVLHFILHRDCTSEKSAGAEEHEGEENTNAGSQTSADPDPCAEDEEVC